MNKPTDVLYNASCPVCRREVDHYAKLSAQAGLPITYDDLDDPVQLAKWGISAEDAAKRLHVRQDGQVYAGLPAFIVLWREIPRMRRIAKFFALPGVNRVAAWVYNTLLAPVLYRMHLRRSRE
ncbi:DUF393 domain-containing protein [Sulfitobacter sp. SK012]|uniref:thiol-disulfide oxidoreductase DCC family protein n=1 Tax=Sulfitobacter sp. SK012 TaxID=1389005 RepID=UPI000E0A0EA0|nr:DUF393 domain-containing protein [Sulfitobacter sp. SK012]AXI47728.1 DUF393 domain-containing protein [Sulfitobacter sp. SK012]